MKLTIFETDKTYNNLHEAHIAHVTHFDKGIITLHFITTAELMRTIVVLIEQYVKFECEGNKISINLFDPMKVRLRFD